MQGRDGCNRPFLSPKSFPFPFAFLLPTIALAPLSLSLHTLISHNAFYQFTIFAFQSLTLNDLLTECHTVHNKLRRKELVPPHFTDGDKQAWEG